MKEYVIGRESYLSKPELNLKSCLALLDYLDSKGVWLIPIRIFRQIFKKRNLGLKLAYFVRAKLILKVDDGLYANPRARSLEIVNAPYEVARHLRPRELFYESLESKASEYSLISQCPNRLTFVTNGKSKVYFTPYGILEFVHKELSDKDFEKLVKERKILYDRVKKIYYASEMQVKEDMLELKRSIDLLEEENDEKD